MQKIDDSKTSKAAIDKMTANQLKSMEVRLRSMAGSMGLTIYKAKHPTRGYIFWVVKGSKEVSAPNGFSWLQLIRFLYKQGSKS